MSSYADKNAYHFGLPDIRPYVTVCDNQDLGDKGRGCQTYWLWDRDSNKLYQSLGNLAGEVSSARTGDVQVHLVNNKDCNTGKGTRVVSMPPRTTWNNLTDKTIGGNKGFNNEPKCLGFDQYPSHPSLEDGCRLGVYNSSLCKPEYISNYTQALDGTPIVKQSYINAINKHCAGNMDRPECRQVCFETGACDKIVTDYCMAKDEDGKFIHQDDPFCRCFFANAEGIYLPTCFDTVCSSAGYKTKNERDIVAGGCPTFNQCNLYWEIDAEARDNYLEEIQQQCIISSNTGTDIVTSPPLDVNVPTGQPKPPVIPVRPPTASNNDDNGNNYTWMILLVILVVVAIVLFVVMRSRSSAPPMPYGPQQAYGFQQAPPMQAPPMST